MGLVVNADTNRTSKLFLSLDWPARRFERQVVYIACMYTRLHAISSGSHVAPLHGKFQADDMWSWCLSILRQGLCAEPWCTLLHIIPYFLQIWHPPLIMAPPLFRAAKCLTPQKSYVSCCCLPEAGRHSDAAHEIRLIGCCILLNVVPKTVPLSGSSRSPLNRLSPFGRLASLEAMRLLFSLSITLLYDLLWAITY